jgi:[acyl-carrier-protein] S-malonyltransferase
MNAAAGGIAFLFPGQGSQAPGMGADLARAWPVCREVFDEADEALGFAVSRLCFEGPASELVLTANTQPAILTVSVAIDRLLASLGARPACAAGHSLGEYSALVAAGVLSLQDAVRAVRLRGTAMQEAVPAGEGAMAAILGLAPPAIEELCREAAGHEVVSPANFNSPEQTVIAGHAGAVARASALAVQKGASKVVPLAVSAPFHCALMRPAETRLAAHLATIRFRDPAFPVVVNADAKPVTTGEAAREALVRQVCSPVRWVESVGALKGLGATLFFEVGPGKVLTALMRRIDRSLEARGVEDSASLEAALPRLGVPSPGAGMKETV